MIAEPLQWILAALGAVLIGMSKTGVAGLGALAVALFVQVFPSSKQASGLVLPLFVFGDVVAVLSYRAHAQWQFLWRLMPWTAAGVIIGYIALRHISDAAVRILIGAIIVSLSVLGLWRRYLRGEPHEGARAWHWIAAAALGVLVGFVTLVANAAGPLMAIYLIAMRLPKMQFVGTAAVFFLALNLFKVPFMAGLGLITLHSFKINLLLAPAVLLGALMGRWVLMRIDQQLFERLVLALSAIAGLLLIL
jgi:uncharacterized membrane protein YfcA